MKENSVLIRFINSLKLGKYEYVISLTIHNRTAVERTRRKLEPTHAIEKDAVGIVGV